MRTDRRGEMGFAEAMIAVITVSVVLMMYIGTVSTAVGIEVDPLNGLETDRMDVRIEDGRVVPMFGDYLEGFMSANGASGVRVSVEVPGGFIDEPCIFTSGTGDDYQCFRSFSQLVSDECGRVLVAVYGVSLCV